MNTSISQIPYFQADKVAIPGLEELEGRWRPVVESYARHVSQGATDNRQALWQSVQMFFGDKHNQLNLIVVARGPHVFYASMITAIKQARFFIRQKVRVYAPEYRALLEAENTVHETIDPDTLFRMALRSPSTDDVVSRRLPIDARRQFLIAVQIVLVEYVDSEEDVSRDLGKIFSLIRERTETGSAIVHVATRVRPRLTVRREQDPQQTFEKRISLARSTISTSLQYSLGEPIPPMAGGRVGAWYARTMTCRIMTLEGVQYYVLFSGRGKEIFSKLLKLERGRKLTDLRGWRFVVVALDRDDGKGIHVPTFNDVGTFARRIEKALWSPPLRVVNEDHPLNPASHWEYRDVRTRGTIAVDNGRSTLGRCEQMCVGLVDWIFMETVMSDAHHSIYKAEQIYKVIMPRWFGDRGVDWERETPRLLQRLRDQL